MSSSCRETTSRPATLSVVWDTMISAVVVSRAPVVARRIESTRTPHQHCETGWKNNTNVNHLTRTSSRFHAHRRAEACVGRAGSRRSDEKPKWPSGPFTTTVISEAHAHDDAAHDEMRRRGGADFSLGPVKSAADSDVRTRRRTEPGGTGGDDFLRRALAREGVKSGAAIPPVQPRLGMGALAPQQLVEAAVTDLLEGLGEDVSREGLRDTPKVLLTSVFVSVSRNPRGSLALTPHVFHPLACSVSRKLSYSR
jgi:hypothetical protein